MIQQLNFYDVYGYWLPGLAWLFALWSPFIIVAEYPIPPGWSATFVALIAGYIAGHLLQRLAEAALPHTIVEDDTPRLLFSRVLDEAYEGISSATRARIFEQVRNQFGLDLAATADAGSRERVRRDAFLLCRRALIQQKVPSYAEQFEGMYALMRGLLAAALLCAAYHSGWAVSWIIPRSKLELVANATGAVIFLLLVFLLFEYRRNWAFWVLVALTALGGTWCGALVASTKLLTNGLATALSLIALGSLVAARIFHNSYIRFARHFAETVYRDFCALPNQ